MRNESGETLLKPKSGPLGSFSTFLKDQLSVTTVDTPFSDQKLFIAIIIVDFASHVFLILAPQHSTLVPESSTAHGRPHDG